MTRLDCFLTQLFSLLQVPHSNRPRVELLSLDCRLFNPLLNLLFLHLVDLYLGKVLFQVVNIILLSLQLLFDRPFFFDQLFPLLHLFFFQNPFQSRTLHGGFVRLIEGRLDWFLGLGLLHTVLFELQVGLLMVLDLIDAVCLGELSL